MEQFNYFIGRQPILNRRQEIVGFELLFRAADDHQGAFYQDQSQASASVISTLLTDFGLQNVLGDKYGFINVTASMLDSEVLELLPVEQSVLELLENITLDDSTLMRCCALKALGFQIALDDHVFSPDHADFYSLIDIVKVDLLDTDLKKLPDIVNKLRKYPVKLLAERVETVEVFKLCKDYGFDLFQGYFFERPEIISHKKVDASALATMELMKHLNVNADITSVEEVFRAYPELSFQLIRLVNSVSVGVRNKVKSLRHAIMLLGIIQLRRWVQLSLYAGKDDTKTDSPLLEMAAVRGRLMELLMLKISGGNCTSDKIESAFLTGILSLLDALYATSMEKIIENLSLSEEISSALLKHEGPFGQLLLLTIKLEQSAFNEVQNILCSLSISLDQLLEAQLSAFNWRSDITGVHR